MDMKRLRKRDRYEKTEINAIGYEGTESVGWI